MLHGRQRAFLELLPEGDPHRVAHRRDGGRDREAVDLAEALTKQHEHFGELVAAGKVKIIQPDPEAASR